MSKHLKPIMILLLCFISTQAPAEDIKKRSQLITAKILSELPNYIKSPNVKSAPTLCVIHDRQFFDSINSLNTEHRSFANIIALEEDPPPSLCNLIYVSNLKRARKLISKTMSADSLLIAPYAKFIDEGGAIGIVEAEGKIAIELNLSVAEENNFVLNPDLIELSKRVIR